MSTEMHARIDELLHDAEHADSGAAFAWMMLGADPGNPEHRLAWHTLTEKRDQLVSAAEALDPQRTAPAWGETTLFEGET